MTRAVMTVDFINLERDQRVRRRWTKRTIRRLGNRFRNELRKRFRQKTLEILGNIKTASDQILYVLGTVKTIWRPPALFLGV